MRDSVKAALDLFLFKPGKKPPKGDKEAPQEDGEKPSCSHAGPARGHGVESSLAQQTAAAVDVAARSVDGAPNISDTHREQDVGAELGQPGAEEAFVEPQRNHARASSLWRSVTTQRKAGRGRFAD